MDERHERVLRQWAAKVISDLPPDDEDARKVLAYAENFLESFLVSKKPAAGEKRTAIN